MADTTHEAPKLLSGCNRCEVLPARADLGGRLYLWFPLGHTYSKVVPYLIDLNGDHDAFSDDRCVTLTIPAAGHEAIIAGLAARLEPGELEDTKALFMAGGATPKLADYGNVTSLKAFVASAGGNWLIDLLEAGRFTSYFQPIVETQATDVIFAHEALFRGLDEQGGLISPARIFGTGKDAGMMFPLDLQARRSAIRQAATHKLATSLFINFNPAAIYDPAFCLRSTLRAVDEAGMAHDRIVFEVVESEHIAKPEQLSKILDSYRSMGFGVALDDLGAGYSSLNLLHTLRPDFVKLDMDLVRGVDLDPYKAVLTAKLLELAHELGVRTIAEGVETEGELAWLRAHGATYVQGFLIAKPAPAPALSTPPLRAAS
jgi:EAL domain-containing protein (putative c-di-GMP-specific phosphodiesterase class I)